MMRKSAQMQGAMSRASHEKMHGAIHGTTVLCVRKDNKAVLVADGQVTMGDHVMKHTARKTRRLYNDKVIAGFAGSTADAISLFERFEGKLQEHSGNLQKAAVELAKEWRKDRALRHLEALLIVADSKGTFVLSGNGDVIEPDDGLCAIGSGGTYALAAARAMMKDLHLYQRELYSRRDLGTECSWPAASKRRELPPLRAANNAALRSG
jgi:ATP-dependent HslUV protease subunit HslV